jgi:hypothetical protein
MKVSAAAFAIACAMAPVGCFAGTASGAYVEKKLFSDDPGPDIKLQVPFVYAVALRKDDVEGALGDDAGIWVLLSDKPVDAMALAGGEFPPARRIARAGAFRGVLFTLRPDADRTRLVLTVLADNPANPGMFPTLTLQDSNGLWSALNMTADRISGSFDDHDATRFSFDTQITENPVTQELRGAAALASPMAQAVIAMAQAQEAGDFLALKALRSQATREDIDKLDPDERQALSKQARADHQVAQASRIKRVTVRGKTARVQADGGTFDLVLEDGQWKID